MTSVDVEMAMIRNEMTTDQLAHISKPVLARDQCSIFVNGSV